MKFILYIIYPPAFVRDMKVLKVSRLDVVLLVLGCFLINGFFHDGEVINFTTDLYWALLYCIFYAIYIYYGITVISFLDLSFSIGGIASVWTLIISGALYFTGNEVGVILGYAVYALIYLTLFHLSCRDMDRCVKAREPGEGSA